MGKSMTNIRHTTAGRKLTQAEFEASLSHNTGGVGANLVRTATLVVAASDSPSAALSQADYVCDGVADEVQINAAITAAAGGDVYLHKGTYKTADEILANQSNSILRGSGFETIIEPQTSMTNSINITGFNCKFENFFVDGNSVATQFRNAGTYNTFSHIYSTKHTTYNLLIDRGGGAAHITNTCMFLRKPVRILAAAVLIDGQTYFNPLNQGEALIIEVTAVNVIGCAFESYKDRAILLGTVEAIFACIIMGNYFESAFTCESTIHAGQYFRTGTIQGNYQAVSANTTNFLNLAGTIMMNVEVNSNHGAGGIKPIVVGTGMKSCRIKHVGDISHNSLTGLHYLEKHYEEGTILNDTAAPGAGTWVQGDKVWNTAPAAGGAPGWVCTTGGTPGTWSAMANLAG